MSDQKWVLYRRNTVIGQEQYFIGFNESSAPGGRVSIETTEYATEALGFDTPREAYEFAERFRPTLDWWRVGLRPHPEFEALR